MGVGGAWKQFFFISTLTILPLSNIWYKRHSYAQNLLTDERISNTDAIHTLPGFHHFALSFFSSLRTL